MRKLTFGAACSLDNFIARQDGGIDWLMWGEEAAEITKKYWKNVDAILMGRKTFEVALAQNPSSADSGEPSIKTYVFSRTRKFSEQRNITVIADNACEFVRDLKSKPGKEICLMGGGVLAQTLFEAGLIDEFGLNIHPVLLGTGIPVFLPVQNQINLNLIEQRTFKNGCVYLLYRAVYGKSGKKN